VTTTILATIGSAGSGIDPSVKQSSSSVGRVYGRMWVKPKLLFARTSTTTYARAAYLNKSGAVQAPSSCVDAIFAVGQAGLTIQGIRVNGETLGLKKTPQGIGTTAAGCTSTSLVMASMSNVRNGSLARFPDGSTATVSSVVGSTVNLATAVPVVGAGVIVSFVVSGAAAWVSAGGEGDVWWGIVEALSGYNESTTRDPVYSGTYYYTYQWAPIEVCNGTASPWGKRTNGQASNTVGGVVPHPAWTDITGGTAMPAWAHLAGTEAEGLAYAGLTTIRCEGCPVVGGKLPDFELLVDGVGGGPDCAPSTAIRDLLVNLMSIPDANVITAVGPDGTYASSFDAYAAAMASSFGINCLVDGDPVPLLDDLLQVVDGECAQLPGGVVRIQPLADSPVGSFVPVSAAYSIGADDIVDQNLLEVEERDEDDCPNQITVNYTDPVVGESSYTYPHDFDIAATRLRVGPDISSKWISNASHAQIVAQSAVRRALFNRKTWRFDLPLRYCLLEEGDLLSVSDAVLPVATVRITKLDGNDDWTLHVEAQEWSGATTAIDITPEFSQGISSNTPSQAEVEVITTGTSAQSGVDATSAGVQTDSLYPDGTSEISPGVGLDITDPAWAGRYNAGAGAYAGSWVRRIVTAAAGVGGTRYQELPPAIVPCVPGERFVFSLQVKQVTAVNGATAGYAYVRFFDASGGMVGADTLTYQHQPDAAWHGATITTAAAPAGAVTVRVALGVDCTAGVVAGEEYWWDALVLRRMAQAEHVSALNVYCGLGGYTVQKQFTRSVLASLTSVVAFTDAITTPPGGAGRWLAVDPSGTYFLAQLFASDTYVALFTGPAKYTTQSISGWQPYGDGVWRTDSNAFWFISGDGTNGGARSMTTAGTITNRSTAAGLLCMAFDPSNGVVFGQDNLTSTYRYCTNGSDTVSSGTLAATAYWQSIQAVYDASHAFQGWLFVGQDANNKAVAVYLASVGGTSYDLTASLPSNANGIVTGGRTDNSQSCSGITCGCVDGVAFITVQGKSWTATVDANLATNTWADRGAPTFVDGSAMSVVPARVKCTQGTALMLPSPSTENAYFTLDGVRWSLVNVSGGVANLRAIAVSGKSGGVSAQYFGLRGGSSAGNPVAIVASGVANETLD
jgi:hypothetical protein